MAFSTHGSPERHPSRINVSTLACRRWVQLDRQSCDPRRNLANHRVRWPESPRVSRAWQFLAGPPSSLAGGKGTLDLRPASRAVRPCAINRANRINPRYGSTCIVEPMGTVFLPFVVPEEDDWGVRVSKRIPVFSGSGRPPRPPDRRASLSRHHRRARSG